MDSPTAHTPTQQLNQKRHSALELEYAVDALDVQLRVLADELHTVEGHGVTGLLGALTGGKQRQVEKIHTLQNEIQQRRDEMASTLTSLTAEISTLTTLVEELKSRAVQPDSSTVEGKSTIQTTNGDHASRSAPQGPALKCAQEFLKRIQAAADACEEARKDVLDEMQTVGTLGRHRITNANRALKMIASRVRKSTGEDCAQRVRQSLSRLHRRLQDVETAEHGDGELHVMTNEIARLAATFSGAGLASKIGGEDTGSWLHDLLQSIGMTLDLRLATAKRAVAEVEQGRNQLPAIPPPLPESVGGDAVEVAVPPQI